MFCIPDATWEEDHGYSWSRARWDHQSLCPAATQCQCAGNLQNFALALHFGRLVRDFIQVGDYVQLACWHRSFLDSNFGAARSVSQPQGCYDSTDPVCSPLPKDMFGSCKQAFNELHGSEPAQKHGGSKVGAAQPCCKGVPNMGHTSNVFDL